jgi:hypothetical protein
MKTQGDITNERAFSRTWSGQICKERSNADTGEKQPFSEEKNTLSPLHAPMEKEEEMKREESTTNPEHSVRVSCVRFEQQRDALGRGAAHPRISWISQTTRAGWRQTGYQIEAYSVDDQILYLSGDIESDQSTRISWPFAALSPHERWLVRVRVWAPNIFSP